MSFKPQLQIRSIPGHRINDQGELVEHEYQLRDKWFEAFAISSTDESRDALIEAFTTEGGRLYNNTHETCPRCRGRGATRKDEAVGCHICKGRGAVGR